MPSHAKSKYIENSNDIKELWRIHQEISGGGPGRKYGVDVINRASIVFISACWESYIEDLVSEAFEFLLRNATKAEQVPAKVRTQAAREIKDDKDETKIWAIADGGWIRVLEDYKAAYFEKKLGNFNTPKTAQVNSLFDEVIGLRNLSSRWYWKGMSCAKSTNKLDEFIGVRGDIAHRLNHNEVVYKNWGTDFHNHITKIVEKTEVAVIEHLEVTVGLRPAW